MRTTLPNLSTASPPGAGDPAARRRWGMWWAIAAIWWTLVGITTVTNYRAMGGIPWPQALRVGMGSALLWIPQTMLALWLADRFPISRDTWRRWLPLHILGALVVVVARALVVVWTNPWMEWYSVLPPFPNVLVTSFANNFFLFCLIIGVGHAPVYARRYRERDEQLARAELHHLKTQLHPHFLFNALNTVSAYVRSDPEVATRMIARLSDLLRHALDSAGTQEVALEEELRVLEAYLEIEQVRFADRLRVEWRIDPSAMRASVPHLILQPLVENAIRHGIAPRLAPGMVVIVAERRNGSLHLTVRDDGVGMRKPMTDIAGVGLTNTRNRLRQLYGARQAMEVTSPDDGGWRVEIRVPFRHHVNGA